MAGVRNSAQSHPPDRGGSDVPQSRSACRCTLARESLPPTTMQCRLVSTPVEAHRYSAFKALLDRAVLSSLLQDFACFVVDMRWELDPNLEQGDFPRGFRGHDLLNPGCASLEIPTMTIGNDPHNRQNAGVQRCCNEVGGRKALTLPLVVARCISFQGRTRLGMHRSAAELPGVAATDCCHRESDDPTQAGSPIDQLGWTLSR